jgi:PAS domain-containing protein
VVVAHEVELILTRELASCLSTPVFVVDIAGTLVYYNEMAEELLGRRFDETGEMADHEWSRVFLPTDDEGNPLGMEDLPLNIALRDGRAAYREFRIEALDGVHRRLQVTAFPIAVRSGRVIGAAALFWEQQP